MALDLQKIQNNGEEKMDVSVNSLNRLLAQFKKLTTISSREKQFFVQNLHVMTKSGLPLDRSLKTLAEQTKNKRFKKIIEDLHHDTEKGVSFKDSLAKYKRTFGELFVSMIEAGELSGSLDEVLGQIYIQLKKSNELKGRIRSAMTYPVIVTVAMILIGIGMLIFVIPKITTLFDQVKAELPFATKLLINVSNFIVNNGLLTLILFVVFIISLIVFIRSPKGKSIFHKALLIFPIIGPIIQKINLAKFARTISSLIKTDIPIVKTFEITAQTLGNVHYRKALLDASKQLKKGSGLAETLKTYPKLFPPVIIQMTLTGEETGKVDEILGELASFYEDELDRIMKTLPSIIEPVLMLVLGVGVAIMAVAIIMPMYTITQQF